MIWHIIGADIFLGVYPGGFVKKVIQFSQTFHATPIYTGGGGITTLIKAVPGEKEIIASNLKK